MEAGQNVLFVGTEDEVADTGCRPRWIRLEECDLAYITNQPLPKIELQDLD